MRSRILAFLVVLFLCSCTPPDADITSVAPVNTAEAESVIPDRCRGDGAVQTWQILPVQPAASDLLTAYDSGEVIEFSGEVFGSDDDPSRLPHRRFLIREAAEGITVTLDYQGDPPPLAVGPRYRMVAWADFLQQSTETLVPAVTPGLVQLIPDALSYELQVHDSTGLLFLGLTDTDLADDPLGIELGDAESDCPTVAITNNPCVQTRQAKPLRIAWGQDEVILYPGEDGELSHDGALYAVSVFRNRQVDYADPACAGYREYERSLRIERIDPPPALPVPSVPITAIQPLTTTLPLTSTSPITQPVPSNP